MTRAASDPTDTVRELRAVDAPLRALTIRSCGLTDRGKVRPSNEDNFLIAELARTLGASGLAARPPPRRTNAARAPTRAGDG